MMNEVCANCEVWKEKQEKVLMTCESIFDAAFDMKIFEEECSKTCPYVKLNQENS